MRKTRNIKKFTAGLIVTFTVVLFVLTAGCSYIGSGFTRGKAADAIEQDSRYSSPAQ